MILLQGVQYKLFWHLFVVLAGQIHLGQYQSRVLNIVFNNIYAIYLYQIYMAFY